MKKQRQSRNFDPKRFKSFADLVALRQCFVKDSSIAISSILEANHKKPAAYSTDRPGATTKQPLENKTAETSPRGSGGIKQCTASYSSFSLFQSEVQGTTPLPPPNQVIHPITRPAPFPIKTWLDHDSAVAESQGPLSDWSLWVEAVEWEDEQNFLRSGVRKDTLRKLRRGTWSIQAQIDLHHHTLIEAREALADFLRKQLSLGHRCIRIIHGKGKSSPNKEPVLKGKIRRWLQMREEILAYCEARPNDGGSGVLIVLLGKQ